MMRRFGRILGAMPHLSRFPEELMCGPFTVDDALRAGVTPRQLRSSCWRRLSAGLYVRADAARDPLLLLQALSRRLPTDAAFSDRTAGWLHGLDLEPCRPVDITAPLGHGISTRRGVSFHRAVLPGREVVECRCLPATAPMRTVFDLARHLPFRDALVAVDMALHNAMVDVDGLRGYVTAHRGARGIVQARRVVDQAEPLAESPMETRLRLLLVLGGLPRPEAQVALTDQRGRFIGRVDLYYATERLALEYDGGTHRDSLAEDNRRQNQLLAAGYRLLRFTAADVYDRPEAVVAQVRGELLAAKPLNVDTGNFPTGGMHPDVDI